MRGFESAKTRSAARDNGVSSAARAGAADMRASARSAARRTITASERERVRLVAAARHLALDRREALAAVHRDGLDQGGCGRELHARIAAAAREGERAI